MPHTHSRPLLVALCLLPLLLGGCSREEHADLKAYVARVKAKPAGRVAPLPEFETYETYTYQAEELRDPFQAKQEASLTEAKKPPNSGIRPNQHRHREALENFPLDSLEFIGLLQRKNKIWGIIKAPDGLVYRAQVGNHLGQNFGRITAIDESRIKLLEIVSDGHGGWFKREAALAIKE